MIFYATLSVECDLREQWRNNRVNLQVSEDGIQFGESRLTLPGYKLIKNSGAAPTGLWWLPTIRGSIVRRP